MSAQRPRKVDVHSHYLPAFYREALLAAGYEKPEGMPAPPFWNLEEHLKLKDDLNISKSYLSISAPGTHLLPGKDEDARKLTRACNDYGAKLKKDHPERFGLFASLSLPDTEAALEEIDYALDVCNADGFVLMTNAHGIIIGDQRYDKVFDKLNARKAVVFFHPTTPHVCTCPSHEAPKSTDDVVFAAPLPYPRPILEFFFETARCCTQLILSGTAGRCPNIRFIISHLGGAFPIVIDRVRGFTNIVPAPEQPSAEEILKIVREQFWYDTAGLAPFDRQYKMVMEFARPDHICYGTDVTWTPMAAVAGMAKHIEGQLPKAFAPYGEAAIEGVFAVNAEKMLAENRKDRGLS